MSEAGQEAAAFEGRIAWPMGHPVMAQSPFVNQMVAQVGPGPDGAPEIILLTFGHASPPLLVGSPEEQREQLEQMAQFSGGTIVVPVEPVARVALSRERAREMYEALGDVLRRIDGAREEGRGEARS